MTNTPHQTGQGPGQADPPADWAIPPVQADVIVQPEPEASQEETA